MARKRLTPVFLDAGPEAGDDTASAPETKAMGFARTYVRQQAPIARVARDAAGEAALEGLAAEVEAARTGGRLALPLPLDAVEVDYLVRDRLAADDDELATLKASLAERGQQVPIDVVDLGQGRFGLISGWRRLSALRALRDETGEDRFGTVLAVLRRPENAAEAYRAMVDENELRVGLSYWERARIAARAAELGIHPSARDAVRALFGTASPAKQSKIGTFLTLHQALDGAVSYPSSIPERLGLALAAAIEKDARLPARLRDALRKAAPADAEAERRTLERALAGRGRGRPAAAPAEARDAAPGIRLVARQGAGGRTRLTLEGPGVTADLADDLARWLASR